MRATRIGVALLVACAGGGVVGSGAIAPTAPSGTAEWLLVRGGRGPRSVMAMAYDAARGRLVLYDDYYGTWEWIGNSWFLKPPAMRPSLGDARVMAYDGARERIVLFGGNRWDEMGPTYLSETWEWDGRTWTERTPAASPPPRGGHAMAYDAVRQRVVVFGGRDGSGDLADTWVWDGSTWVDRTPAAGPPARANASMAFDAARGRVVLFGGYGSAGRLDDTWEWDGTTWTLMSPATSPSARSHHAMTYDAARQRVVLFGGSDTAETWEWDGTTWTERAPATRPPARYGAPLVYDSVRGRAVLFGGIAMGTEAVLGDTWEWDGTDWVDLTPPALPESGLFSGMVYDVARERALLYLGQSSETWHWDGDAWTQSQPASTPTPRFRSALAYDAARERAVLFGGADFWFGTLSDTWEWDGAAWVEKHPATSPSSRSGHAMAYDRARERIVLFGGDDAAETWTWDGVTWSKASPATLPPARARAAMAYDAARGRVVLFGGLAMGTDDELGDTWEWDGSTWRRRSPATSPSAREQFAMAYDAVRRRVVLFGGYGRNVWGKYDWLADTWEWDGEDWVETTAAAGPVARIYPGMTYDANRGRVVLFGGQTPSYGAPVVYPTDTWEYGVVTGCAHATEVGAFTPGVGTWTPSGEDALGARDGQAVSLGSGGSVVLRLEPPIESGPGTDFIVYELGRQSGDVDENFRVEASAAGTDYVFVGDCPGGACHLDLTQTGLVHAAFVRITDLPPQEYGAAAPHLGADIDAVTAVHCTACTGPDTDSDGHGDACDNCPTVANADQADADADEIGNACDPCPLDAGNDGDGDGLCGDVDNCPTVANADQADFDGDGHGNACESAAMLADADNSNRVDGFDLAMLGRAFGSQAGDARYETRVDLNRDAIVDGDDLALMLAFWAQRVSRV